LAQISPNPFSRRTAIRYSLPKESDVALRVYNSAGRVVTTLVSGKQRRGWYAVSWDVSGVPAARLPCGTYFCRLEAGEHTATRKMVKTD
jgi:flagellar hook assembly protein FlgD